MIKNNQIQKSPIISGSPEYDKPADQVVIRRSMDEEWPVSPNVRGLIMRNCEEVLSNPESDQAHKNNVARTVIMADKLNIERKKLKIMERPKTHLHLHSLPTDELQQRVRELAGVDDTVDPKAAARALLKHKGLLP